MNLFLDLETIPSGEPLKEEEIPAPSRMSIPDTILKWRESKGPREEVEKEYRGRSLNSLKCNVLCLAYAFEYNEPEILTGTDKEVIQGFNSLLNRLGDKKESVILVGHNIKEFDVPIIYHRAIRYNQSSLLRYLDGIKYVKGRIFDTMVEWGLTKYKDYTSLDNILNYLGFTGKGEITGANVYDYYMRGELEKIYDYCKDDVKRIQQIYKRMKS